MIYLATTAASLALALALAAAPQGGGERLVMQGPEPAVVRLGGSALVLLRVDTRKNPPTPKVPHVEGLRTQLVNRGTEERRSFVNGRQSYRRSVRYDLYIRPLRGGKFTIPPFEVDLGSSKTKTRPIVIEAAKDIHGKRFAYLDVEASATRVYVHEPIRFRVDYGVDKRLSLGHHQIKGRPLPGVSLQAPWLDQIKGLEPMPEPELKEPTLLGLNNHPVAVAYDAEHQRGNQTYHGFRLIRSFLPTQTGTLELTAPVLKYTVVREGLNSRFAFSSEER